MGSLGLDVSLLPSAEDVQQRVNERYDSLFHVTKDGERLAKVCTICDEFLIDPDDVCSVTISKMRKMQNVLSWRKFPDERRTAEIEQYFSFNVRNDGCNTNLGFLKGMALSPRGLLTRVANRGRDQYQFTTCKRCKGCVSKESIPRHAILNKNYVGAAPKCLTDLNEVELAFLSPVKGYGYCFTYVGGKQRNLKGTLTFMRVEKRSIGKACVQLEQMGFNKHVLVLFSGGMTSYQRKKANEKCTIRTDKIFDALDWLVHNNIRWKNVDLNAIRAKFAEKKPIVHDRSHEVESENTNIETKEIFTCYYPDGASTPTNGGFEKPEDFKQYVEDMAKSGYDVEFQADLQKDFVTEGDAEVLLDACLLQFPYGFGAMNERRKLHDGSWTTKSDLMEYLQHLSKLSQTQFQSNFFQLVLYSLGCKYWLLHSSRLSLRGKTDAKNLAENLSERDVISCINGRRLKNRNAGTNASRKLLDAVDATARALPHTNEASRRARGFGESMQHHFGMSSVFLTVTFDDENSFLMQVMSNERIDDDIPSDELTDQEVLDRSNFRRELRIKYPGIATMNFEILLEILMFEVVGWDMKNNCRTEHDGFFGIPEAVSFAVEEQGRKTLHVHMTIWIRAYKKLQEMVFHGRGELREKAARRMQEYSEHISSTEFFPKRGEALKATLKHDCNKSMRARGNPVVVPAQSLRNLRNRRGYKDSNGEFAFCPDCDTKWTYEEMVNLYIRNGVLKCLPVGGLGMMGNDSTIPKARMLSKIVEYQKSSTLDPPKECINATYQHHVSCHVSNCFKCQKKGSKKRGHVCGPDCECRYRMPDLKRPRAELLTECNAVTWYLWNGDSRKQPLMQVCPKRGTYDLFQNVSCNAISHSKFSCNSNVSCVIDGPIGAYQHKYKHKDNQKEETAEYAEVAAEVKKFASDRKHEMDRPEALRRICRAAFAHNRTNIVSASLGSYLLRHGTRFYQSHQFQYCPLKDLVRLHNKQEIKGTLKYAPSGECYFENHALHYLCRHSEIETVSLRQFVEEFEICHVGKKDDEVLRFQPDTGFYSHPSVLKGGKDRGKCSQGVRDRTDGHVLIRVSQWMFPDTASFKHNIFTCSPSQMNTAMEEYAQLVLTLFLPHRHVNDLKAVGVTRFPYLEKLREVYEYDRVLEMQGDEAIVFKKRNVDFLQNMQDARSNSLRYKMSGDPLAKITEPYQPDNPQDGDFSDDEEEEEEPEIEETAYELFTKSLEGQFSCNPNTDDDPEFLNATLRNFKFDYMKDKGRDDCGREHGVEVEKVIDEVMDFVDTHCFRANANSNANCADGDAPTDRKQYSVNDIVQVLLKSTTAKVRKNVFKDKDIVVGDANGSIKSIREWSKACFGTDKKQARAFEVLISSFLLTFYDERAEDKTDESQGNRKTRSQYRKMMGALKKLRGIPAKCKNLICLLHGSGGSGKSTVINTVKAYAAEFCKMLGHPFTTRTIVVTAMSGVAATLIGGETTHSVLGLNRDTIQNEERAEWVDARLLIIDEISFASAKDFEKMNCHMAKFTGDRFHMYGGMNVVFAGDYSQLEPVGREPVYNDGQYCAEFQGALNSYIELDGKWRFHKDPAWGDIMARFREGTPTLEDIDTINRECHIEIKEVPVGVQVATYTNKDRDAINASIFEMWTHANRPADDSTLKSACMIFMDELYMNDGSKTATPITSNMVKRHFYENCTESECNFGKNGRGRVDPVLKLYPDCPMMLTMNTDVANGVANGTRVRVKKVKVKGGENAFELKLDNGTTILALYASQVDSLFVEHENEDITPRQFSVLADDFKFKCRMTVGSEEMYCGMKGRQFPIISNSCTTGHKLQGCTVESILANDWYYGANWPYVVLSRVKTMAGLYIRKRLSKKLEKYEKPEAMKKMLAVFRDKIYVPSISDEEYEVMEKIIREDALFNVPASMIGIEPSVAY